MGTLCKNETIDETDKIKLKMINAKRLIYKGDVSTQDELNSKLQELGYSEINIEDPQERDNIKKLWGM